MRWNRSGRGRRAAAVVLLVLFCATALGIARRRSQLETVDLLAPPLVAERVRDSLRVDLGGDEPETNRAASDGWSYRETGWGTSFAWVDGPRAALRFVWLGAAPMVVRFRARPPAPEPAQVISASVNGRPIGQQVMQGDWTDYEMELPADALRFGDNQLELTFAHVAAGAPGDERQLAAAFVFVDVTPADRPAPPAAGAAGEPPGTVRLAPGEGLKYLVRIADPTALDIEVACDGGAAGGAGLSVWMNDVGAHASASSVAHLPACTTPDGRAAAGHLEMAAGATVVRELYVLHDRSSAQPVTLQRLVLTRRRAPAVARPNVLLVVLDALRADHLHAFGYERDTAPWLERLGEHSAVFTRAFAQAPMTIASVPSLLTGTYPPVHRVTTTQGLGPDLPTLAEVLGAHGYATVAFSASPFVVAQFGLARGFAEFFPLVATVPKRARGVDDVVRAETMLSAVQAWLAHSSPAPWFMYLHFLQPHAPYAPPPPYRGSLGSVDGFDGREDELTLAERHGPAAAATLRRAAIDRYDENIRYVDGALGRLLRQLALLGELEQTVVVVTADHGEQFLEHSRFGHPSSSLYEESIHVPLIIREPGGAAARIDALVESIDVPSTILELAGIAPPLGQGRSLVPLLRGSTPSPEWAVFSFGRTEPEADGGPASDIETVRTGDRKLVRSPAAVELYDLDSDPEEQRNLAADRADVVGALTAELAAARAVFPAANRAGAVPDIDARTREHMRALGYSLDGR
jgi:arylsulfatase A-like enzyme